MTEDFMTELQTDLSKMRLLAEGAVSLYENDAASLYTGARKNQQHEAANALETIGEALYALRHHVSTLQTAHSEEAIRLLTEDERNRQRKLFAKYENENEDK